MDNVFNPTSWDHTVFARLFAQSPKQAFEYRLMAIGTPIPDEWLDSPAEEENKVITSDEIKKLLTEEGVQFHFNIGEKKLRELAIAHGII